MPAIKKYNDQMIAPCTTESKMAIHALSLGRGLYRSAILRSAIDKYIADNRDEILQAVIRNKSTLLEYFSEDVINSFVVENGIR